MHIAIKLFALRIMPQSLNPFDPCATGLEGLRQMDMGAEFSQRHGVCQDEPFESEQFDHSDVVGLGFKVHSLLLGRFFVWRGRIHRGDAGQDSMRDSRCGMGVQA